MFEVVGWWGGNWEGGTSILGHGHAWLRILHWAIAALLQHVHNLWCSPPAPSGALPLHRSQPLVLSPCPVPNHWCSPPAPFSTSGALPLPPAPRPPWSCRGISGGQKRRLTCGELLVGGRELLLLDEISTGEKAVARTAGLLWLAAAQAMPSCTPRQQFDHPKHECTTCPVLSAAPCPVPSLSSSPLPPSLPPPFPRRPGQRNHLQRGSVPGRAVPHHAGHHRGQPAAALWRRAGIV
jgi:hypothetical protein